MSTNKFVFSLFLYLFPSILCFYNQTSDISNVSVLEYEDTDDSNNATFESNDTTPELLDIEVKYETNSTEFANNTDLSEEIVFEERLHSTQFADNSTEVSENSVLDANEFNGNVDDNSTNLDTIDVKYHEMNATKTIEEIYEEQQQRHANDSIYDNHMNLMINITDTEKSNNSSLMSPLTRIMPAMPGIPIFRSPPEFKIHDPDEGPLEVYFHPSNTTDDSRDQQFVFVKRPHFVAEKGSLEEKYKHLLVDSSDDDIELPQDIDAIQGMPSNNTNNTDLDFSDTDDDITTTIRPETTVFNPLPMPPMMPFPRPYPYYHPFQYGYQPYVYPYYNPYYMSFNPNPYYGFNSRQYGNQWANRQPLQPVPTQSPPELKVNDIYKMLPKSFQEFGAKIAEVTVDETADKQSKDLSAGDSDTLEVIGPLEPSENERKEIQFIINAKNNYKNREPNDDNKVDEHNNHNTNTDLQTIKAKQPFVPNIMNFYAFNPFYPYNPYTNRQFHRNFDAMNTNANEFMLAEDYQNGPTLNRRAKVVPKKKTRTHGKKRVPRIRDNRQRIGNKTKGKKNSRKTKVKSRRVVWITNRVVHRKANHISNMTTTAIPIPLTNQTLPTKLIDLYFNTSDAINATKAKTLQTLKPKYLFRAKIRNSSDLKVDENRVKWWLRDQPSYCHEDIYVSKGCEKTEPNKRWSYNSKDSICYAYEDYCYELKPNSFKSSKDCFRKCYRVHSK